MQAPNLCRIVEVHIPITDPSRDSYIAQLRSDLMPSIRRLQSEGKIIWFSFLLHDGKQRDFPVDCGLCIHIRLCPPEETNIEEFIQGLPKHFEKPCLAPQTSIQGVEGSVLKGQDWAYAWKLLGETSEWVLQMIDAHEQNAQIPVMQIIQFLHFATNALGIGLQSKYLPTNTLF